MSNAAKVQTALKLSEEDQATILALKKEIEKAWKLVDASHEKVGLGGGGEWGGRGGGAAMRWWGCGLWAVCFVGEGGGGEEGLMGQVCVGGGRV